VFIITTYILLPVLCLNVQMIIYRQKKQKTTSCKTTC